MDVGVFDEANNWLLYCTNRTNAFALSTVNEICFDCVQNTHTGAKPPDKLQCNNKPEINIDESRVRNDYLLFIIGCPSSERPKIGGIFFHMNDAIAYTHTHVTSPPVRQDDKWE